MDESGDGTERRHGQFYFPKDFAGFGNSGIASIGRLTDFRSWSAIALFDGGQPLSPLVPHRAREKKRVSILVHSQAGIGMSGLSSGAAARARAGFGLAVGVEQLIEFRLVEAGGFEGDLADGAACFVGDFGDLGGFVVTDDRRE